MAAVRLGRYARRFAERGDPRFRSNECSSALIPSAAGGDTCIMSYSLIRNWLIAYDIADPRRLRKVHRFLKQHAIPVQYSAFVFRGNQMQLDRILSGIAARIKVTSDDVRAYHLPSRCEVAALGIQHLPVGIVLPSEGLGSLLNALDHDK